MSEILFYHLERHTLEQTLPVLLEKTLERGWKAVVQTASPEQVKALDEHLWRWRDNSFLPHMAAGDEQGAAYIADQPIFVTDQSDTPNAANVLFLVDGATRETLDAFDRCVIMFDGRDEETLAQARAQWAALKDSGHELTYWQQNAEDKWEKRA